MSDTSTNLINESNCPNLFIEISTSILKIVFIYICLSKLGYLLGIIAIIGIVNLYKKLLEKACGMNCVATMDTLFIGRKKFETMTLVGIADLSNFTENKAKEKIKEAIGKLPKLNSRLHYLLGNYFWAKLPITDERLTRIIKIIENVKDYDEAIEYCQQHINIPLDLNTTSFECHILKYTSSEYKNCGAMIFKIDHSVADGLNILSLLLCLADNFSLDIFPKSFNKKSMKIIDYIKTAFDFVLMGWYYFFILLLNKSNNKIFTTNDRTGVTVMGKPQAFQLDNIKTISKKLGITINDLIVSIISITIRKMTKTIDDICIMIPIGNSKAPKKLEDVKLHNTTLGIVTPIPLINHIEEHKKISNVMRKMLGKKFIAEMSFYLSYALSELLPFFIMLKIGYKIYQPIDAAITNVPGPTETIYYNGCKVKSLLPFSSIGMNKIFIVVFSYCNSISITPNFDKIQNLSVDKFNEILNEEVEKLNICYLTN